MIQSNTSGNLIDAGDGQPAVTLRRRWLRRVALLTAAAMGSTFGFIGVGPVAVQASGPFTPIATVELGLASTFGALTPNAAFASTGATTLRGDTGSTTYDFAPEGDHIGTKFIAPDFDGAVVALTAAYADAAGRTGGTALPASLAGLTLGPGLYTNAAAVGTAANTTVTFDGQGHEDAVFILQVGGALSLGAGVQMALIGGAQAQNVFWKVTGAGTIGADSTFVGTMMANGAVAAGANSVVFGRLLTKTGAISMGNNDVYATAPTVSIDGGEVATVTVSSPVISGTTSVVDPATVTVTIDGIEQADHLLPNAEGAWTLTLDDTLSNGDHVIVASVRDGASNLGTFTQTLTVDAAPPVVAITSGALTNDSTPTITGTTEAGAAIEVTSNGVDLAGVVVDGTGWSVTATSELVDGFYAVRATATDAAGNTSYSDQILEVDITPPVVAITSGSLTKFPRETISGTSEAGATIGVSINGVALNGVDVGANGGWSARASSELDDGDQSVVATATDAAGNSATATQTLTVDTVPPVVVITSSVLTTDSTPTISGTTEAGAMIEVSIDGDVLTGVVVDGTGWSATATNPLADGDHSVVATATDAAGNTATATQTLTVDLTPPAVAITSSAETNNRQPTIEGTTESGATITVSIDDSFITVSQVGTTWSATPADGELDDLTDGTHQVEVVATGINGLTATDNQILSVDLSPPDVLIDDNDDGDPLDAAATTSDVTPAITGVTNADAGQIVTVTFGLLDAVGDVIQTVVAQAVVQGDGTWNVIPILSEGVWSIEAAVSDEAGNTGSSTQVLTVDLTAPALTVTSTVLTNNPLPTITGTTEAGAAIAVDINGLPVFVTPDSTAWSATPGITLVDGDYTITVTAADAVGNTATASQVLTVDTTAPAVTIVDVGVTNDPTPEITFTTEAVAGITAVITATGGDVVSSELTQDSTDNDAWSATPGSDLVDGDYTIAVTVTDGAGNEAAYSMSFTVDTEAPVVTIVGGLTDSTNDVTPTIVGSAVGAAGETVVVTLALPGTTDDVIRTALVQDDGTWNVTPILSEGDWSITAEVTDEAGNTGSSTQTLTVDLVRPNVLIEPGDTDATNSFSPWIVGSTDIAVGQTVEVTFTLPDDAGDLVVESSAFVQDNLSWGVVEDLSDGVWRVLAEVTDEAGNTGSFTQFLTVDTTAPVVSIVDVGVTNDPRPEITFATEAGATVTAVIVGVV
ncbi:MAG: hypothetical protein ACI9DE_001236, partial [Halioglobus sp.]